MAAASSSSSWIEHTLPIGAPQPADASKWNEALAKALVFPLVDLLGRYKSPSSGRPARFIGFGDVGPVYEVQIASVTGGQWFTLKMFAKDADARLLASNYVARLLYLKSDADATACARGTDRYSAHFRAVLTDDMKVGLAEADKIRRENQLPLYARMESVARNEPQYFVEMERVAAGQTIAQLVAYKPKSIVDPPHSGASKSNDENVFIVLSAARALRCLHERGIFHRALSTDSVVISGSEALLINVGQLSCVNGQTCGGGGGATPGAALSPAETKELEYGDISALGAALYDWLNGSPINADKKRQFKFTNEHGHTKDARPLVLDMMRGRTTLEEIERRATKKLKKGPLKRAWERFGEI